MRFLIIGILMGFPVLEGVVLYNLAAGHSGHGGWVLAWLLFAAIAGVVLIKQARFSLISRLASALSQGQFSLAAFIDSFRTVLAGLLLIFPGVISDVMALALLLIPVREPALEPVRPRTGRFDNGEGKRNPGTGLNSAIEGEFRREN